MHLRTVFASLAACGIAFSALSIPASADILNSNHPDGHYMVPLESILPEGNTPADVYGVRVLIDGKPHEGQTVIGGICWQSDTREWQQKEYGMPEERRPLVYDIASNTITMVLDAPLFDADETGCELFVAEWNWDNDNQANFLVRTVKVLDANGNELQPKAQPVTEPPAKIVPPQHDTPDKPTPKDDKPAQPEEKPHVPDESGAVAIPEDTPENSDTPIEEDTSTDVSESSAADDSAVENTDDAIDVQTANSEIEETQNTPNGNPPDNAQHGNNVPVLTINEPKSDSEISTEEVPAETKSDWQGAMLGICLAVGGLIVAGVAAIFACKKV